MKMQILTVFAGAVLGFACKFVCDRIIRVLL